jgi:hypothetical protein
MGTVLPMAATASPAPTVHYVVTLKGSTDRVSVWGLDEFRALKAAKRIVTVHSCTPLTRR